MSTTNTTNRKPTKRIHFTEIIGILYEVNRPDLAKVMEHEMELLNRKNSTERKPTERQVENAGLADAILFTLTAEPDRLFTIAELIKEVPGMPEDMTPQRMSAILRNTAGVVKSYEKRKAYFSAE